MSWAAPETNMGSWERGTVPSGAARMPIFRQYNWLLPPQHSCLSEPKDCENDSRHPKRLAGLLQHPRQAKHPGVPPLATQRGHEDQQRGA